MSRTNVTNLAKSSFDKVKKITSSSDYLKNKKFNNKSIRFIA